MEEVLQKDTCEKVTVPDPIYLAQVEELCDMIKHYGITKIISYDDEWKNIDEDKKVIQKEEWLEREIQEFRDVFISKEELSDEQFASMEQIILFQLQSFKISDILGCEIAELASLKKILHEKFNIDETTINMLKTLKELLDETAKATGITCEYQSRSFKNEDVDIKDEKILFIIDKDMSKNNGPSDSIKQVIPEINLKRPNLMDLILVYTNDDISNFENHEDKIQYFLQERENIDPRLTEEDAHLLAYQLWPFKKTNDKKDLAKSFNNILKDARFGHSLHDYLVMKISYRKKMNLDILKIPGNIFKYLYKDTFIEGNSFIDTLSELEKCIYNNISCEASNDDKYKKIMRAINLAANEMNQQTMKEINELEDKENNVTIFRQALIEEKVKEKLYENLSEHGIADYSVNSRFAEISTGDIFSLKIKETGNKTYGILLSQECDLVVRFQGKGSNKIGRVAQKADLLLCNFLKISNSTTYDKLDNKIWPIIHKDKKIALEILGKSKIISVDIKLLDLCSLNADGKAKLDIDSDSLLYKTSHFRDYFENTIKSWIKNVEGTNLLKDQYTTLYDYISRQDNEHIKNEFFKFVKELEYKVEFNERLNAFEIERVARLEKNHVLSIIQSKYHHMSRIGVPSTPMIS